jgi:uncharacterized membrane protein
MTSRWYKIWLAMKSSLWLIPVLRVLVGAVIPFTTITLDRANDYALVDESIVGSPDAVLGIS